MLFYIPHIQEPMTDIVFIVFLNGVRHDNVHLIVDNDVLLFIENENHLLNMREDTLDRSDPAVRLLAVLSVICCRRLVIGLFMQYFRYVLISYCRILC